MSKLLWTSVMLYFFVPPTSAQSPDIPNGDSWVTWDQATRQYYITAYQLGYLDGIYQVNIFVKEFKKEHEEFMNRFSAISPQRIAAALDEMYSNFENRVIKVPKAASLASFLAANLYDRATYQAMIELWREKSIKGDIY